MVSSASLLIAVSENMYHRRFSQWGFTQRIKKFDDTPRRLQRASIDDCNIDSVTSSPRFTARREDWRQFETPIPSQQQDRASNTEEALQPRTKTAEPQYDIGGDYVSFSKRSGTEPQILETRRQNVPTSSKDGEYHRKNSGFPCPLAIYGCPSVFRSKNEWKRHVIVQHMRLQFWQCCECKATTDIHPCKFNRKDLLAQHIRRMHPASISARVETGSSSSTAATLESGAAKSALENILQQCCRKVRSPPEKSACMFCDAKFNGAGTWQDRMEHVGKHMEDAIKAKQSPASKKAWLQDPDLNEWLAREGIITERGDGWVLAPWKT